ncbi:MAG: carboxymuconolactone decarboxylase family protein [Mycobacterium sp.]|uniref:carboxymuconolactone decarboxylase family protein n=1 Tax=Mycobacterium sp. TaxID=1785 RepID=UPI00260C1888|nr:carboxymuconolactone decarboxylase family protein [Mycobacterium sp.]MDI3312846.1 carboxymuconolactone decarboxylase family protein [Mycobacterium sp.]
MTGGPRPDPAGRIPSGGLRELGPVNWLLAKFAARTVRVPEMHLFTTLGRHRRLFRVWLAYSGVLLRGRLPRADTELVILRVAQLRACGYELQHHRRMARRRGLDAKTQDAIVAWPQGTGEPGDRLTPRQQALLRATDEFVTNRSISAGTWQALTCHFDLRQLIEFCMLAAQYDGLAATISALDVPLDHPQDRQQPGGPARGDAG